MGSNEYGSAARGADSWLLLAVFAVLLAIYSPTVATFYNLYTEEGSDQTHAPLLLLVVFYLLYRTWSQSGRRLSLRLNRLMAVPLILLSLLWMLLGLVFVEAGQQAMLILIVVTVVLGMLGLRGGGKYLMPILLLITLLPIWNLAVPYLQIASAVASGFVLDLIGVPSIREGYLLIIPNGTFEVADACSGLKFQIVGITLALIHTQLIKVPLRVTLGYALLASLLALVTNIIRVVTIVVMGYYFGMTNAYVQDHNFIGWSLFSVFFFLLLFFGEQWLRRHQLEQSAEVVQQPVANSKAQRFWGVAAIVFGFSVGPLLYGYFTYRDYGTNQDDISVLTRLPGWKMTSNRLTDWKPVWTLGDHTLEGSFKQGNERVELFATRFLKQRQGHEAAYISHTVYNKDKWSRISRSARVVKLSDTVEATVEETLLKRVDLRKRLVWQWYRTNDKIVASKVHAKLNNLFGVISGEPEISVFVLSKEITRDQAHATEVLEQFLRDYLERSGDPGQVPTQTARGQADS